MNANAPMMSIEQLLYVFSIIGTVVFAVSGALFAAEKRMDILGFILVGTVTGVGGGTLRDLLLGISPVSWVQSPLAVYICIGASALTYFTVDLYRRRDAWILWTDAIGLSVFAVMGVMTATFGGLMRDVLCAEVLTLMRPEIYITSALLGASTYVGLHQLGVGESSAAAVAFLMGFGLRGAAIWFRLTLPRFGA